MVRCVAVVHADLVQRAAERLARRRLDGPVAVQVLQVRVGLPHDLASAHVTADGATLVGHMLHDKKMAAGTLPFLLARGIGQTFLSKDVALDDVAAFLDQDRAGAL